MKSDLRKKFKKIGADLLLVDPSLSDHALQVLLKSELSFEENKIGLYYHRPFEVNLLSLWKKFPDRIYFPLTHPQTLQLHYHTVATLDELKAGFGNVFEPVSNESTRLKAWSPGDIILIPGLSFDKAGYRLGSGMGIFDRYLATLPPTVITVGICLEEQLSPALLPRESHDIPVKMIATPNRVIKVV